MCPEVALGHGLKDSVPLPEGEWNPPLEGWLIYQVVVSSILGDLQRVPFLQVLKLHPFRRVILKPD